ncbi:lipoprotein [Schlegelella sp. ID0723]|uniref:Lipoprotein n=2 Tax=Piscinibacter koreensis TaxID=2742824 RepID=A0A7Y6NM32_9BURK|nr:lipoprotein [Schlegelella koreensis]
MLQEPTSVGRTPSPRPRGGGRRAAVPAAALALAMLAGCGQKGPLIPVTPADRAASAPAAAR